MSQSIPLQQYAHEAYLDYAMYVILDRALPHVADGLKPVQRRIIYAMSELGLKSTAKYKKSARTVGDVIGKFHPHGDSACYEAMVLMAQPFSYRYPLIDGHGNWGSPDDPKSFAAMRYTESRLTAYANSLLEDLAHDTVSWQPNFDASQSEPSMLPAKCPNILLNGSSGIAVGMATDIPPHNLGEVVDALVHVLENPETDVKTLCQYLPAPDYPTGAEIISSRDELVAMYQKGNGVVRQRAIYRKEDNLLVFDELPFQVSSSRVIKQVAEQMLQKQLPAVLDVRDESDYEVAIRLVVELKSKRVDSEVVVSHLFATTDLEKNQRVNFNMIGLDRKPAVKNLLDILTEWLSFRRQTTWRRLSTQKEKIAERLHILDGLLLVFVHIDSIIQIVRQADKPKQELISCFDISERQAVAILEMRLRQLAKLEYLTLEKEQRGLQKELKRLQKLLNSPALFTKFLQDELLALKADFADARRSRLVERQVTKPLAIEKSRLEFEATVALTAHGWLRLLRQLALTSDQVPLRPGDSLKTLQEGSSTAPCLLLGSSGRMYNLSMHDLSTRGYGEPVSKYLNGLTSIVSLTLASQAEKWLLCSSSGYGFVVETAQCLVRQKNGKQLFNLKDEESLLPLMPMNQPHVFLFTQKARALVVPLAEITHMAKGRGVRLLGLSDKDQLQHVCAIDIDRPLTLATPRGHVTVDVATLKKLTGKRALRGKLLPATMRIIDQVLPQ